MSASLEYTGTAEPMPFIVGMPRSGKTIIRLMLDSHPDLAIPPDTHFLGELFHRADGPSDFQTFHSLVTAFYTWPDFHLSSQAFEAALAQIHPFCLSDALRCFYSLYAHRFGKRRFGDKTPEYGYWMTSIQRFLPEAHFIHVVRDGRDIAVATRGTHLWKFADTRQHAKEWVRRHREFRRQGRECIAYKEVHFETLIRQPSQVLKDICSFICLHYEDSMLRFFERARTRTSELEDIVYERGRLDKDNRRALYTLLEKPLSLAECGRWKAEMSREEIAAYEDIAGPLLSELGYELTNMSAPGGWRNGRVHELDGRAAGCHMLNLSIKTVERVLLDIPFKPLPAEHLARENPLWRYFQLCRVTLECGVVGVGETMLFYNYAPVTDRSVQYVIGRNAAELIWDDTLGSGLQQAIADAVGKALDLPIYRLFGEKHRDRAEVSWWAIDMPGEDWARECAEAMAAGYTAIKLKGRPWFDLNDQLSCLHLPSHFRVHVDFNELLCDAASARSYLNILERFQNVSVCEEVIRQNDAKGMKLLRGLYRIPTALHIRDEQMLQMAVAEDVCDGFLFGRVGALKRIRQAWMASISNKPICIQNVGTAITTAYSLHFAAVIPNASWPLISCSHLFVSDLIQDGLAVANGAVAIPSAPGIGVIVDQEKVERFTVKGPLTVATPRLLIAIRWPSGGISYYTHTRQYWDDFMNNRLPLGVSGVRLEVIPDDGSHEWQQLQGRAANGVVHSGTCL